MLRFEMPIEVYQFFDSALFRNNTTIAKLIHSNKIVSTVDVDGNIEIDWTPLPDGVTYSYKTQSALPREVREIIINNENWREDNRIKVVKDNHFRLHSEDKETDIGNKIEDIRDLFDMMMKVIEEER